MVRGPVSAEVATESKAADVEHGSAKGSAEKAADPAQTRADAKADEEEDRPATPNQASRFHFIMAAAAMYMAMILTNWSNFKVGVEGDEFQTSDFGEEAMWIKIVSQWITSLLYIWWLLAPLICKDRDFSD
jgi:hypothetical protein